MADEPRASDRETSPLLGERARQGRQEPESEPQPEQGTGPSPAGPGPSPQIQTRVLMFLALAAFSFAASGGLALGPLVQIMKDTVCRQIYGVEQGHGTHDIPPGDARCESKEVQAIVAYLCGFTEMLDAIVGLLVAFPFGILADKIGRKPVIILAALGGVFSLLWVSFVLWFWDTFPARLMLWEAAFQVVGGGTTVVVAVLYSMVADVVSEENRANAYFILSFASLSGSFVGPFLASWLMQHASPWLPLFISIGSAPVVMMVVLLTPETLPYAQMQSDKSFDEAGRSAETSFKSQLLHGVLHLKQAMRIVRNRSLVIITMAFLTRRPELYATTQFFLQYVNKRFHWTIAEAGYLLGVRAIVNILVLLVALPLVGNFLLARQYSAASKDLLLAKISAFLAGLGFLFMAGPTLGSVVFGLTVNTLAAGFTPLCRSLATSYVDPRDTSKLYTMLSIVETTGSFFGGPTIAWLFDRGMQLEGPGFGLPYFGLAAIFILSLGGLMFVKPSGYSEDAAPEHVPSDSAASGYRD